MERPIGTIRFLLNNKIVGEAPLTPFSEMSDRHKIAKEARVEEYDDFHFMDGNMIRMKGSSYTTIKTAPLNQGQYEGKEYQNYKK